MADAIIGSEVTAKNSRSQFCFDYGKQEGDPADHTIHLEIKNFIEFTRNKSNKVLKTDWVDILGSKTRVGATMSSPSQMFTLVVLSPGSQRASLQYLPCLLH